MSRTFLSNKFTRQILFWQALFKRASTNSSWIVCCLYSACRFSIYNVRRSKKTFGSKSIIGIWFTCKFVFFIFV